MDSFLLKQKYASTENLIHFYGKALANSSVLCPSQVSHAQLLLPGWMITDTTSGSAGQKPKAGATPQFLDIMVGQHDRLKCGMVILVKPKKRDRNSLCGT